MFLDVPLVGSLVTERASEQKRGVVRLEELVKGQEALHRRTHHLFHHATEVFSFGSGYSLEAGLRFAIEGRHMSIVDIVCTVGTDRHAY